MNQTQKNHLLDPVTPGELLNEEFLAPLRITKYRLAKEISVPAQRIGEIVAGKRSISADTDLRLCKYFGLSMGYWLRVQNNYDIEMTRRKIQAQLNGITPLHRAM
ncbi:MAG: addiction module antidote protein, HigA family [Clostridia bacterium]|nr:addiction module antidote protein, HigA family [Clostridia bacterium]